MTRLPALFACALLAAACATAPAGPPPLENGELANATNGTAIAIKRGGELKVILDTNPTLTLPWQGDPSVGPVLAPIGERVYVGKTMNAYDIAGGGMNIFRYRAEQAGKVTLHFASRRAGDPGPIRAVAYEVTVE